MSAVLRSRAAELGRVGESMVQALLGAKELAKQLETLEAHTANEEYDKAAGVISSLERVDTFVACAASMLMSEYPIQVAGGGSAVCRLLQAAMPPMRHRTWKRMAARTARDPYPLKSHPGLENKTNIFFSEVWEAVRQHHQSVAEGWLLNAGHTRGWYNDQAAGALAYASLTAHYPWDSVKVAVWAVNMPEEARALSLCLKSLGLNSTPEGAVLCELDLLIGRGAKDLNIEDDMARRFETTHADTFVCDEDQLRQAVRQVLEVEVVERPEFKQVDDFWSARWEWCVNGSHSLVRQHVLEREGARDPGRVESEYLKQWHRRAAMEHMRENPLSYWDGRVFVSVSKKLEAGKTRALYACDTVSYTGWEHFLRPIEKVWRGRDVLLDPGGDGHDGIVERMQARGEYGHINVMLDYADFNSAHTVRAMQIVTEEAIALTGYDSGLGARLVRSLGAAEIHLSGKFQGKARSTLMSGHRGTTFFNSVLNRAYLLVVTGGRIRDYGMMHTGDDVYGRAVSFNSAFWLLKTCERAGLRMNRLKQSVGVHTGEFTRIALRDSGVARGYLTRSVSSFTAGNWYTDHLLDPEEALAGMVQSARSLGNRSGSHRAPQLLRASAMRVTGLGAADVELLLSGRAALRGRPAYATAGSWIECEHDVEGEDNADDTPEVISVLPRAATEAYLERHASPVERRAIELAAGPGLSRAMAEASFGKSIKMSVGRPATRVVVKARRLRYSGTKATFRETRKRDKAWRREQEREGLAFALTQYPLLYYLKSRLRYEDISELMELAGVQTNSVSVRRAFGLDRRSVCINGKVSYSDASSLCADTERRAGHVHVLRDVLM